jgi:glycosyltransferase involved in cell wall biosynthesis
MSGRIMRDKVMGSEKIGRLIVVDPSLKDERGHHYSLAKAISDDASQRGIDVIWYVSSDFQIKSNLESIEVRALFTKSMYEGFKTKNLMRGFSRKYKKIKKFLERHERLNNFVRGCYKKIFGTTRRDGFNEQLLECFKLDSVGKKDKVLVHTADGRMYREILDLSLKKGFEKNFPDFHLCTPYDSEIMPHNKVGFRAKQVVRYLSLLGLLERKIFLYAENSILAEHLAVEWGVKVEALEIPAPDKELGYNSAVSEEEVLEIVYMGAAREEKGFHLLPDIIENLLIKNLLNNKIHFTVQASPQIVGYSPVIISALRRLRKINENHLTLIDEQQSMSDYYSMLKQSDVVLLCYDSKKYKVRGSGIATEAVAFGKVVLGSRNTFATSLAGNAAVYADSVDEIVEEISRVAANKLAYLKNSRLRMEAYRAVNMPGNYISKILNNSLMDERESDGAYLADFKAEIFLPVESMDVKTELMRLRAGKGEEMAGISFPQLIK